MPWRRGERLLVGTLVGLALLAVGLQPASRLGRGLLERLALRQLMEIEKESGGSFRAVGLHLRSWGRLHIDGLELRGSAASPEPLVEVEELEITWELGSLLLGRLRPAQVEAWGVTLRVAATGREVLSRLGGWSLASLTGAAARSSASGSTAAGLLHHLPGMVALHDLRIVGGSGQGPASVQRVPLAMLLARGDELSGVVELAGEGGAAPVFFRLAGSRRARGSWQVLAEASEPVRPTSLRQWLGRSIGFSALELGPDTLAVRGLTVSGPEGQGSETMVRVDGLTIARTPGPEPRLQIELDRPELRLESYPDGRHSSEDLERLLSAELRLDGDGDPEQDGGAVRDGLLPGLDISLRRGKLALVRYRASGEPDRITLDGLQADLRPAAGQVAFTALWQPAPDAGKLVAEGHLGRGGSFSLRLRPDRLSMAELGRSSSLSVREGVVSGDLVLARTGDRITVGGMLALEDLGFSWGVLAREPLTGLNARLDLSMHHDLPSAKLVLESLAATVGELELSAWGQLEVEAELPYEVTVAMGPVPCRDIPGSLPRGMLPLLEGLQLEGHTTLRVHAAGSLLAETEPVVQFEGNVQDFAVVRDAGPDLARLDRPFVHTGFAAPGRPVSVSVDPAVPGFTSYEGMAGYLRRAVVSAEDANFYNHHGVDFAQIRASLGRNIKEGRLARGGSTITQQVVKNLFLSREKTLARKLQESFLAWKLENALSKRRILEIYLNIIEWGPGIFGAKAAASYFFDKHPADLTLNEAVFLAAILPNPAMYARQVRLGVIPEALQVQMGKVLKRMRQLDYLTDEEYARARQRRPTIRRHPELPAAGTTVAGHF